MGKVKALMTFFLFPCSWFQVGNCVDIFLQKLHLTSITVAEMKNRLKRWTIRTAFPITKRLKCTSNLCTVVILSVGVCSSTPASWCAYCWRWRKANFSDRWFWMLPTPLHSFEILPINHFMPLVSYTCPQLTQPAWEAWQHLTEISLDLSFHSDWRWLSSRPSLSLGNLQP